MASALRRAMRYKLSPQEADDIAERYSRFGGRQQAIEAYERRRARAEQFGINNLNDANAQQIRRAAEAGLIGRQPQYGPIGSAPGPAVPNQGGPFGQGSGKPSPMMAAQSGPGIGGSPTPGRPVMGAAAVPAAASSQFTPLGLAMAGALPRKRIRNPAGY